MDDVLARQLRKRHAAPERVFADRTAGELALSRALDPFEVLYDEGGPAYAMPAELEEVYGRLGFARRAVYANFVSSIDGVVTLGRTPSAGSVISGHNRADRFLMGLLRACADAVLVGAGTLRGTPGHRWTPAHVFPDLAPSFAELREELGRAPEPRLVVLTASADIDLEHPAIVAGATVVTTHAGAGRLEHALPPSCDVIEVGDADAVEPKRAVDELRGRGYDVLLTEGGPHLMGQLIKSGLLDELFLTVSPVMAGRERRGRLGVVAGAELLPDHGVWSRLMSVRRHGSYVFVRYSLAGNA